MRPGVLEGRRLLREDRPTWADRGGYRALWGRQGRVARARGDAVAA